MGTVALLRDVAVAGISLPEPGVERLVAERVSSCAAKTVFGGDVSVAERSGVVKPMSWVVETVGYTPRLPLAVPGNEEFRGYEKCALTRISHTGAINGPPFLV